MAVLLVLPEPSQLAPALQSWKRDPLQSGDVTEIWDKTCAVVKYSGSQASGH